MVLALLLLAAAAEGRPLFYWGARPPVIVAGTAPRAGAEASVTEVHAALDGGDLVLRFAFDRPVREAIHLPDGTPVSGRLRAILYLDADEDRRTGLDQGPKDLRTGADRRLEIGVLSVGADPEERRPASALVTASLASLDAVGRRRSLWRGDTVATPLQLSVQGEHVHVRILAERGPVARRARLILAVADRAWEGRIP